jgi:outer membrane immunogenic protein
VSGLAVGVTIDARQSAQAEDKLGPSKWGAGTKEERAENRKREAKRVVKYKKEAEESFNKICDAKDEKAKAKATEEWNLDNVSVGFAIRHIIENSEDLTEAERSAIDDWRKAEAEWRAHSYESKEKLAPYEDKLRIVVAHFWEVMKKRREAIEEKIEKGEEISYTPECSTYAALPPGPIITISGELGWGGSSNGFEDYRFSGNGVIGGISGQVNFPIGGGAYTGFGGSVLGSGISGSKSDPITSNIRLLVPIDGIIGVTFAPSGGRWPLSLYGFGGLAIGDVNISASPFSATQTMGGWSIGVGADLQLSPNWSVGLKYRHFDLGNATFSVFPGGTSFVSERGDMVTGTLSYRFPISPPAPVAPILTK